MLSMLGGELEPKWLLMHLEVLMVLLASVSMEKSNGKGNGEGDGKGDDKGDGKGNVS